MDKPKNLPMLSTSLDLSTIRIDLKRAPQDYKDGAWRAVRVSDSDLHAVSNWVDVLLAEVPTPRQAADFAEMLMGYYRAADFHNPKIFAQALCAIFASHSLHAGAEVSHPVNGICTKMKFMPALSEVSDALEAIEQPLTLMARSARAVLEMRAKDAERQAQQALADEQWRKRKATGAVGFGQTAGPPGMGGGGGGVIPPEGVGGASSIFVEPGRGGTGGGL